MTSHMWGQQHSISRSFQQEPISNILEALEQKFDVLFAYDPQALSQENFSGTVPIDNVTASLTKLLSRTSFTFEAISSNRFIIVRKPAQDDSPIFNLNGRIFDAASGEPLGFAKVFIPELERGALCDGNGNFHFEALEADLILLEASFIGYKTAKKKINISRFLSVNIELEADPLLLKEVVIAEGSDQTLHVADAPGKIQINPQQIATLSGLGEPDIMKAIQLLPGVKGTNVASAGLYVRGGTPDQNLLLFDDITAYRIDHFLGLFSAFNSRAIKSINVYRGGFGASYGGRVSSVIDVKGKLADFEKPHASVGASLLNAHSHLEIPLLKNKASLLISARRSYSDFLNNPMYSEFLNYMTSPPKENSYWSPISNSYLAIDQAYAEDPKVEVNLSPIYESSDLYNQEVDFYDLGTQLQYRNTNNEVIRTESTPHFNFFDANAKLSLNLSDDDFLSLTYYQGGDELSYNFDGKTPNRREIQNEDQLRLKNMGLNATWLRRWDDKGYSKLSVSSSQYGSQYTYGFRGQDDSSFYTSFIDQSNRIQDYSLRTSHFWQIDENNQFEFGAELTHKSIRFLFDHDTLHLSDFSSTAGLAGYVQHTFSPEPNTAMTLGLRSTFDQRTNKIYFDPRLSLDYRISPRFFIKGAWGIYHQFVNRVQINNGLGLGEEFWALSDGNDIPVQMANHVIFGTSYRSKGWMIDVEAYHKFTEGILTYSYGIAPAEVVDKGQERLLSGGHATVKGIDLLIQKKWNSHYTGWIAYSLSKVNEKFMPLNLGEVYPALHDQRHELKWINQVSLGDFEFATTWMLASGRPYTKAERVVNSTSDSLEHGLGLGSIHAQRLPVYHRLDISFSYQFELGNANTQVGFSVYNVYNRKNVRSRRFFVEQKPAYRSFQPSIGTTDVLDLGFSPNIFLTVSF